jgi:aminopeptidase N
MRILCLLLFLFSFCAARSQNRVDSVDVLDYDLSLTVRNFSSRLISGTVGIRCVAKIPATVIRFDLLKLAVQNVTVNGNIASWERNDSMLFVVLPSPAAGGDSLLINISYQGEPAQDPKWGGFYFTGDYAFNMGVGFVVDPHPFGRCWFPCFDDFRDRATYSFHITTDSGYRAVCNGLPQGSVTHADGSITWHWRLEDAVASYLAQVAVSKYELVSYNISGINRAIPTLLAARETDTTALKNSFVNLPDAVRIFEDLYGPYAFSKVGFTLVPFNAGAMEHATNIAYPAYAADGSLSFETLMAHELSHHWWGDLVTCKTPGEMWLNEGWASFSENVFLQGKYGDDAYKNAVKDNHLQVLRYAHIADGGFRAVSGVPHAYTYGQHVYNKGADVIHALRTHMDDSAFFAAARSFISTFSWKNAGTTDLRDHFQNYTPRDLTAFFNERIMVPGFASLGIKRTNLLKQGLSVKLDLDIMQDLRAAPEYYSEISLDISLYDQEWKRIVRNVTHHGPEEHHSLLLDFTPVLAVLDEDGRSSLAMTGETVILRNTITNEMPRALFTVKANTLADSALLRVDHYWTAPERTAPHPAGLNLSNYRYWKVDGVFRDGFSAYGFFYYNGSTPADFSDGYLDHTLIQTTEDSLELVWRPHADSAWQLLPDTLVTHQPGLSKADKIGRFWVRHLLKGEYAFAAYDQQLSGVQEVNQQPGTLTLIPNPSKGTVRVEGFKSQEGVLNLMSLKGEILKAEKVSSMQTFAVIDLDGLRAGMYIIRLGEGSAARTARLVIP